MKIMMDKQEARRIAVIEQSLARKFNNQAAAQLLERPVKNLLQSSRKSWHQKKEIDRLKAY